MNKPRCQICALRCQVVTDEDVYPQWLREEFLNWGPPGIAPGFSRVKLRPVCDECNGTSNNLYEASARPILLRMILGKPTTVTIAEQETIARWMLKTEMMFALYRDHKELGEADDPEVRRSASQHRQYLVRMLYRDPNFFMSTVRIGWFASRVLQPAQIGPPLPDGLGLKSNLLSSLDSYGPVFAEVVHDWTDLGQRAHVLRHAVPALNTIWPATGPLTWPPTVPLVMGDWQPLYESWGHRNHRRYVNPQRLSKQVRQQLGLDTDS